MKKEDIKKALEKEKEKSRSAWKAGVIQYAIEILDNIEDKKEITEKNLLDGAEDWKEYSYGGCSLIYNIDICNRLCTPSEIKKTRDGERNPNSREIWLDTQARALHQAARLIMKINNNMK